MAFYSSGSDPKVRKMKILMRVFQVIGILLIAAGLTIVITSLANVRGHEETTGEIVGFTSDQRPMIRYTVDGQDYEVIADSARADRAIGDEVRVRYDPASPQLGSIGGIGSYVSAIILMVIGAAFTAVPTIFMMAVRESR